MFHTADDPQKDTETFIVLVVIPWRGFRCFTQNGMVRAFFAREGAVVIPWRGFRCFTPAKDALCKRRADLARRCNPLAGI